MFKKPLISLTLLAMVCSFSVSTLAQEDVTKPSEIRNILKSVKEKDPTKMEIKNLTKKSKNISESNQGDLKMEVDSKIKKIKISHTKKGNMMVGMPANIETKEGQTIDDQIVFTGKSNKADIIVQAVDGGVRQVINIKSSDAPSFYDFPLELEKDEKIILNEDGSALITRQYTPEEKSKIPKIVPIGIKVADFAVKFSISKPWAIDANGKNLSTRYEKINDSTLRQIIELKDAVFPVTADPIWCGNAINNTGWIQRDGVWSDSIYPTSCGAWNCGGQWNCWQEVYDKTKICGAYSGNTCTVQPWGSSKKTNYWSMYNQFMCHADIPKGLKVPWNIEPSKADKGYWGFANFSDQCN